MVQAPGAEHSPTSIVAERGGATFAVSVPGLDAFCHSVALERDLDGDGLSDALIESGGCGNVGHPVYFFLAGTTSDHFVGQELGAHRDSLEVEIWRGRASIVLESDNEGWNLDRPQSITRRFVFQRGRAVMIDERHAVEMTALADLRAEDFVGAKLDEERTLSVDLDGDRMNDAIVGTLWQRWGRIVWQVRFADGRVSDGGQTNCKRLGVLADKTKGYRDLVCDFDTRLQWNGQSYDVPEHK